MQDFLFDRGDLAPGDHASVRFNTADVEMHRIVSADEPLFEEAYRVLWQYFGLANELEPAEVLARRLDLNRQLVEDEPAMLYDLVLLRSKGSFVAAIDHTAVADERGVMVHVSHVLVDPLWRRSGLGGWLRALPIQTARRCLRASRLPADLPITLVAEVEYPDGSEERTIRLRTFERSGFKKLDPGVIDYQQPDFRPPEIIDATGGPVPLPFQLIIRRIGREGETHLPGDEVRWFVENLYRIYSRDFREKDMAVVWQQLETYPPAEAQIDLIPPTSGAGKCGK